jgi:predicted Zn-dependent peptidase
MSVFRPAVLAVALATALSAGTFAPQARAATAPVVDIAYESFTLPNGLRVIVHTDRKAPIVAVNVWYHVGSKDEPAGRSGFAHLFEHLMFNGSENNPGEFFGPFKQVGATDQNGTTNSDRTNYFENVPTTALDMALWMESDRMGHLLGAIDQKTLDEQRGVVQNEKRQGENQPYGQVWDVLGKAMYPVGHPYNHSTIGSMNDLNAASLDDVKTWFKTWYGPNNAVLVLAGDIDVATAKEKVAKYFGDIPAGPTMAQPKVDVAAHTKDSRGEMTDNVPQSRIYRMWNVAEYGQPDLDRLQLFAQVLGGGKSSRLDRRLVHQDKLVDNVGASAFGSQLGSNFMITAAVKQGVDVAKVEAAIDEELQKLLKDGPTADELARARTSIQAGWIRGVERIGGFGGKADALAECAVYTGDPGCFRDSLKTLGDATVASVRATGNTWLGAGKGSHTLVVNPGKRVDIPEEPAVTPAPFKLPAVDKKYATTASAVDRKAGVPVTTSFPDLKFPSLQRATLKNGTKVVLAERHDIPVVQMSYEFRGGQSADPAAKLGTASFAMGLLDEGAGDLDALAFADRAESLGANLGASAGLDSSSAYLSSLKQNLEPSVALYADMLRKPRFEQADIDRVKGQWIAGIKQEKVNPGGIIQRVVPGLVYGSSHPYGAPRTGSGTEASIAGLTRADLVGFHGSALRPQDATLVVVGDTTLGEIVPVLEKHFGDWTATGAASAGLDAPGGRAAEEAARVPDRPARRGAGEHRGRPAGAVQHGSGRGRLRHGQHGDRRRFHRPPQHEPARGQALVVRCAQRRRQFGRPAHVDGVGTGADRQDRRVGGRDEARDRRLRQRQAGRHRRGSQRHAEDPDPEPARRVRDRGVGDGHDRQQPAVRPPGRLRVQAQGRDRGDDPGAGGRGRQGAGSERVDLGGRGRPVQDRAGGARAEPGRGHHPRRRRQAGGQEVSQPFSK